MDFSEINDKTSKSLHVQYAHSRLNFLHQGSIFVSSQGSSNNDAYAKLSRQMIKNFREILNTERVKVDPQILRSFCGQCKQVFVAKTVRINMKMVQKKLIQRTCVRCGTVQNYNWNKNYRSRNETSTLSK